MCDPYHTYIVPAHYSHVYDYLHAGNIPAVVFVSIMGRSLCGARRAQWCVACLRSPVGVERAREVNRATLQLLGAVFGTYLSVNVEDRTALRVQ